MSDTPPSNDRPAGNPRSAGQRRRRGGRGRSGQGGGQGGGAQGGSRGGAQGGGSQAGSRGSRQRPQPAADGARSTGGGGGNRARAGKGGRGGGTSGGGSRRSGGTSSAARSGGRGQHGRAQRRPAEGPPSRAPAATATAPGGTLPAPAVARSGDHRVQRNLRRMALLCVAGGVGPGLIVGLVLGLVVDAVAGLIAGAVVLVAVALGLRRTAESMALRTVGGVPAGEHDLPALVNLVDGLSATFGVRPPHLRLIDDPVPNACSVGGTRGRAVLVVTSGLVGSLDLIEMEGVVAHELAHVKAHDAAVSAVAVATAGVLGRLTGADGWLRLAVGAGREYDADRRAVLGVRYPPGLRDALAKLEVGPAPASGSVFTGGRWAATRWLWIDPMVGSRSAPEEGLLDATAVRRDALGEW